MELLELYLSPLEDPTRFKVIVTESPAGQEEEESCLPFRDAERDWRITIIKTLEVPSFSPKSFSVEGEQDWMVEAGLLAADRASFHPNYLVNIGQALYRALFPRGSKVEAILQQSIRLAEKNSTTLVVRLKLKEDVARRSRLADYPWELLHEGGFLCHHQVEFTRYIAYGAVSPNIPTTDKLNVLLVSSAAYDEELKLDRLSRKEQKAVRKGLEVASGRGDIFLEELEKPTFAELRTYLTKHPGDKAPHVLHFDGHGLFGKRCRNPECRAMNKGPNAKFQQCRKCNAELPLPQGYLMFSDERGDADYISAEELGTLLQKSGLSDGTSQARGVALVVLSACQSGMAVAGESVFNGAAQNLIAHRVPAVVAMQYSVNVDSATRFAEQFYRSLGQKHSLALAVSKAREAMGVDGNQWYRPVLYLRWQDNEGGQIFELERPPTDPRLPKRLPTRPIVIAGMLFLSIILYQLIGILFPELSKPGKYTKLESLLASEQFQKADEETWCLMLQAVGQKCQGWPPPNFINNVPCQDLLTIDRLWVKSSDERFGFSIQNEIYQELVGKQRKDDEIWGQFQYRVGWPDGALNFNNIKLDSSPRGHLPWQASRYKTSLLFDRVEKCVR